MNHDPLATGTGRDCDRRSGILRAEGRLSDLAGQEQLLQRRLRWLDGTKGRAHQQ